MNWQPMLGYFDGGNDLSTPSLYESALRDRDTTALPALAYRSKAFADLEDEKIWTRTWSCIGYSDRIPRAGDLYPFTIGQHGIHVQRQADGSLKAHFNFAQHGGCRYVPRQCQTGKKTSCFYTSCGHSRDRDVICANDDGSEPPEMYMYVGINPLKLLPIRLAEFGPLLFVNLDTGCATLEAQDGASHALLAHIFSQPACHSRRHRVELACNWKLAGKLFLESGERLAGATLHWLHPNLLVLRTQECIATAILQPTAMNETMMVVDVFAAESIERDHLALAALASHLDLMQGDARALQRALAGAGDPSPFLPQAHGDRPLAPEPNPLVRAFNRRLVRELLVRHEYVDRPLFTHPGRSLNAGVNSGAF